MEQKKNPKADLEKRKGLFFEIGLVVILAACLVAFNLKSYDKDDGSGNGGQAQDEEVEELDEILDTDMETPPPPPPPAPEEPELNMDQIEVVQDNVEIKQEVKIEEFEDVKNTQITEVKIEEEQDEDEVKIFTVVENDPEFPGGMDALYKYLAENIKYPQLARDNGITGKVYVTFVVERDGSIANPKILRDIGGGCGAEAIRVVKAMPKWTPGKQRGKAVRVQFNLPVNFNLR
jgi:protein TonB